MKITGELLKAARNNQELTIQQVALSLKITSKIIVSIEAGDTTNLPAKTFLRGFVKSYAELLKLDPEVVLRQFQEEMGTTSPLPKVPPPKTGSDESIKAPKPLLRHTSQNYSQTKSVTSASIKKQNLQEQNINNKILMSLFGAVVLVVILVGVARIFENDSTITPATITESDSTNVIIPNFETIDPMTIGTSGDLTKSASGTSSMTTSVVNTQSPAVDLPVPNANEDEILPSPGKPVELILEGKKDTEIFYSKGNTKQFKPLKLIANKLQIIRSASGIHLKAADGSSFKITVNGVDIGNAGPTNKPVKLSF